MKITPDAAAAKIANLQAITATEGQLASAGKGATRAVVGAPPMDPKALKAPLRADPSLRPPVVGTPLVLSVAARQLSGPPPPATLAWAHQVVEALTGLKLPPPLPGTPLVRPPLGGPIAPTAPASTASPLAAATTQLAHLPFADTDRALFHAQGQVFPENAPEVDFSLQLFAERSADAPHVPPAVSPVLARMLGSHPLMPPLSLRFQGPAEQLKSAVFHFEVEPSVGDPAVAAAPASGPSLRLLGLLVLNPQLTPVYDMHVAGAAAPRTDPAAMMAAMGFHPLQQPPFGKVVLDVAASLLCSDDRCPFYGQGSCPQPGCRRHEWSDHSPLPPDAPPTAG